MVPDNYIVWSLHPLIWISYLYFGIVRKFFKFMWYLEEFIDFKANRVSFPLCLLKGALIIPLCMMMNYLCMNIVVEELFGIIDWWWTCSAQMLVIGVLAKGGKRAQMGALLLIKTMNTYGKVGPARVLAGHTGCGGAAQTRPGRSLSGSF